MEQKWMQCLAALTAFAVSAATAAEAVPARAGDKPLVVNGNLSLTTLDFDAYMERVPIARRDEFRAEYEKINPTVDGLWMRRVLAAKAREAGMDKDPLVAARMRLAVEDVLADVYLADVARKVVVPNMEPRAREIYKAHLKEFTLPETVGAQHILISTKTYSHEQAAARAQEVYARAKAGEDFAALARQYSDALSSLDLPPMPLASYEKPIPEALEKLHTKGEITPPVESRFGFHILKLVERHPAQVKPFDEVKESLMESEKQKVIDEARTAVAEAVRSDPKNYLYLENVRALKSDFKIADEARKIKSNPR